LIIEIDKAKHIVSRLNTTEQTINFEACPRYGGYAGLCYQYWLIGKRRYLLQRWSKN